MGWLRDLMQGAAPPIGSFDELARLCLAQASWPAEISIQKRSLGALFGKLDREVELEWLSHRPSVQAALAKVLGTSREELILAFESRGESTAARYLRLDDLPTARPVDLLLEDPFPGIPSEVLRPAAWSPLWWVAPSGSGRSLVRAWLATRGLLSALDDYCELDDPNECPTARPGLCVAAPFLPPAGSPFRIVRSAPLDDALPDLVDWAQERLPEGARSDRSELIEWLRRRALSEGGWLESPGAVLGCCGLASEFGLGELTRRSGPSLAAWVLRRRATELLDPDAPSTEFVKRRGAETIIALLRQSMVDADEPWWVARELAAWARLLPTELRREDDVDWLKLALVRRDGAIREKDLERAARTLPPGAFRVLRALTRVGVLRRANEDRLALRPHWLVEALATESVHELARAAPSDWGEGLLREHSAPRIARAVFTRVLSGDVGAVDESCDLEPGDSPALAAAVECVLRCAGIAALRGIELPSDSLEALWDRSLELAIQPGDAPPEPRIRYADAEDRQRFGVGQALLSAGGYYLASWAVSEQLSTGIGREHPLLRPWTGDVVPERARPLLDAVLVTLERCPDLGIDADAARLFGRLSASAMLVHPLTTPARLLASAEHGVLALDTWLDATSSPFVTRAVAELLAVDETRSAAVYRAVWQAWSAAGSPLNSACFEPDRPFSRALWQAAPAAALDALSHFAPDAVAYELLSEPQWQTLVASFEQRGAAPPSRSLWLGAPDFALARLLSAALEPDDPDLLAELWRRKPVVMRATVEARFTVASARSKQGSFALLAAAPARFTAELAEGLAADEALGRLPAQQLFLLERWLHERVSRRGAGFRAAYARLAALERRLSRARL